MQNEILNPKIYCEMQSLSDEPEPTAVLADDPVELAHNALDVVIGTGAINCS